LSSRTSEEEEESHKFNLVGFSILLLVFFFKSIEVFLLAQVCVEEQETLKVCAI
ncbi:hypothetical protein FRX31_034997, partial [Thalictrum thalictroides]